MKCVILSAGRGTRMGELCDDCPKPMLPIKGRPKLAYTLDILPESITEVIFVVGYLQEQIREYFGAEHMGRKITYVEQEVLSGTADALMLTAPLLDGEKFLVLNGDDLYDRSDLEKMLENDFATLGLQVDDISEYAFVQTYDDGTVRDIIEAPHDGRGEGIIATGAFVLTSDFFALPQIPKAPGSDEFGLPQTLIAAHPEIKTQLIKTKKWYPIGHPENLEAAQEIIHDFL